MNPPVIISQRKMSDPLSFRVFTLSSFERFTSINANSENAYAKERYTNSLISKCYFCKPTLTAQPYEVGVEILTPFTLLLNGFKTVFLLFLSTKIQKSLIPS